MTPQHTFRYTLTVLGQHDPAALHSALDELEIDVHEVLDDGPALRVIASGPARAIERACAELIASGRATAVIARLHLPPM
jgi:hypothetical protein